MNQRERREIEVFNTALELTSSAERAAYLDQACQGEPALRHKVEALLSVHTAADAIFEKATRNADAELAPATTVHSSGTAFLTSPVAEAPGTVIDRYKVSRTKRKSLARSCLPMAAGWPPRAEAAFGFGIQPGKENAAR
ncbi:MAG: hypothetical protein AB9869_26610 [Verrucomicrobiia bacterium]